MNSWRYACPNGHVSYEVYGPGGGRYLYCRYCGNKRFDKKLDKKTGKLVSV